MIIHQVTKILLSSGGIACNLISLYLYDQRVEMTIEEAEAFAFQQITIHASVEYPIYVINGSATKQNEPVDFSGYLIMINSNGDTIAGCSPNGRWRMYPTAITGTHLDIASNPHALSIP